MLTNQRGETAMSITLKSRSGLHFALSAILIGTSLLAGCGGGGGSSSSSVSPPGGGGPGGGDHPDSIGTTFHVNVATGEVTVTPPSGQAASTAIQPHVSFGGSAVTFNPSQLIDVPGDAGVKSLSVSLTNHWGMPIGTMPTCSF